MYAKYQYQYIAQPRKTKRKVFAKFAHILKPHL
jgi:hypothetical protein